MTEEVTVAVVGAGPAGLEAAITAAQNGAEVLVLDSYLRPGGQYFKQPPESFSAWDEPESGPAMRHRHEARELLQRLASTNVRVLTDAMVWGAFPVPERHGWLLTVHGPAVPSRIFAKTLILATGAYDRPVPFPGWTLPGVFTAGAVQTLLKYQRVLPGRRFVLSGSGPLQLAVAAQLLEAGADVAVVLEALHVPPWKGLKHLGALWGQVARLREGQYYWGVLREAGVPYRTGSSVVVAQGASEIESVTVARLDKEWRPILDSRETIDADTLVLGYGFVPATQLTRLLGCDHDYEPRWGGWLPRRNPQMQTTREGVYAVGDGAGIGGAALARIEGKIAGLDAARYVGCLTESAAKQGIAQLQTPLHRERRFARMLGDLFTPAAGLYTLANEDTVICRCEEVRLGQIKHALDAGARSAIEVKGLTRCGMGNCQGRICGELLPRIIARRLNEGGNDDDVEQIKAAGSFTVRPPIHPLPLSVLADAAEEDT
jgi:NADPH-dependent 2,4-dienoyl-CoA reductase/sulfur reductase-like enzyme